MTHQHESWNVSIKSSTSVCLTEFTISPKEENENGKEAAAGEEVKEELSNIYLNCFAS